MLEEEAIFLLPIEDDPKTKLLIEMAGSTHLDGCKVCGICREDATCAVRAISLRNAVYDTNSSQDPC